MLMCWPGNSLERATVMGQRRRAMPKQPTYPNPIELNGQRLQGSLGVAQYGSEGSIALTAKGTEAGMEVVSVMAGGPAAIAGLLPGDIIVSMDGASAKGLKTAEGL